MTNLVFDKKNLFARKFVTTLITGLTISALILVIGNGGNIIWFPPVVVFPLVASILLTSLVFPIIWQKLENKQKIDSNKTFGLLYSLVSFVIAINLISFGWKKIFGLQFLVPTEIAKLPMNQQSGEWLTWFYFGYSETFGLIIASIQIFGSILLFYRKTVLVGSLTLFSLMLNLTLINIFYKMNLGALLQSVILTF